MSNVDHKLKIYIRFRGISIKQNDFFLFNLFAFDWMILDFSCGFHTSFRNLFNTLAAFDVTSSSYK